ncbi:MAG: aminotransferase class I/II-fold pyridoxal phosphate-dependent enzyme, partial [bacterium]
MKPRDLTDHTPYKAGRGIEEVAREYNLDPSEMIKLSSNENDLGPSPEAVQAIRQHAENVHRYPKSSHTDLIDTIAEKWEVSRDQVWLSNSGDAALEYIARAMLEPGDQVLVPDPGFAYYPMSARYHHGEIKSYKLEKRNDFELTADTVLEHYDDERIIYVNSPHNPTGSELSLEVVESIAERTRESTLVLVDEAYAEFTDTPSKLELIRRRDDVAVLRTFSKVYGLAGLRLGYLLVPDDWASAYERVNTPF